MDRIVVGVSGINAADNPGPGIGVARSLKEDPDLHVEIVGLAYDAMEPGLYMDWVVDKAYIMPYPGGGGEAYLDRLLHIQSTHGLDFVIPSLDAELPLYIRYARTLKDHGIGTCLPDQAQFDLRGKDRLGDVAERIRVRQPKTRVVASPDQLAAAVGEIGLPVMVKGLFYKAYRAGTVAEALHHGHAIAAEWGYPLIVQGVVTGEELNVIGLGDGEGGTMGLVGIKKILITSLGKIWTGVTVKHEAMRAAAEAFVKAYRWRGPFELECIVSDGEVWLIEINPRFPAWLYFATGVGINLPGRMLRRHFGRPVPPLPDYEAGRLFVRYSYEIVTDMDRFQRAVTRGETP